MTSRPLPRPIRRAVAGFTLIEVLIVLVIVLAIGAVVAVNLIPVRDKALNNTELVQLRSIEQALDQFNLDIGRYPTEDEGLAALWDKTKIEDENLQKKHIGNYFAKGKKDLKDRWGNAYGYRPVDASSSDSAGTDESEGVKYELWSNGADGEEGTADDIKLEETSSDSSDTSGGGL